MTAQTFNEILEARLDKIRAVLVTKAAEYATNADRLHNFKAGAALSRTTPAGALLGYMTKHFVSVIDMVRNEESGTPPTPEKVDEKIGDAINYLILLEAVFLEQRRKETNAPVPVPAGPQPAPRSRSRRAHG